jgi:Zn ribbon nucleic-acid-binding protein
MPEEEVPYEKCYACGYDRTSKHGKISRVRYHDKDEDEPVQMYIAGTQKCECSCHPEK